VLVNNFLSQCQDILRQIVVFKKNFASTAIDFDKYIKEINNIIKDTEITGLLNETYIKRISSLEYLLNSWYETLSSL